MVATKPVAWAVSPEEVEPEWQFLWRDMSLAIPFWQSDGAPVELVERIDLGSQDQAGGFAAAPEGLAYNNNRVGFYLGTTQSHREYSLTRTGAWTLFWAIRFDDLQANSAPIRFGESPLAPGHWSLGFSRISGEFRRIRFRFGGTPGTFTSDWELPTGIPPGYRTFCFSMPGDRQSLHFYLDGVDQGRSVPDDTTDSYLQPTVDSRFRLSWTPNNLIENYALFVSRDAFVAEGQAAKLHNDPWAWVRPAPTNPTIFGAVESPAGGSGRSRAPMAGSSASGRVQVTARGVSTASLPASLAAGGAQVEMTGNLRLPEPSLAARGRVQASARADSRTLPPASRAAATVIVGGVCRSTPPLPAQGLQASVPIVGSIAAILEAARSRAAGNPLTAGRIDTTLESPRQAAAGTTWSAGQIATLVEPPSQAATAAVPVTGQAEGVGQAVQLDADGQVIVGGEVAGRVAPPASRAVVRLVVSAEGVSTAAAVRQAATGFPLSTGAIAQQIAAAVLSAEGTTVIGGDIAQQTDAVRQLISSLGTIDGSIVTRSESPRQAADATLILGPNYPARLYVYDDAVVVVDIWDERPPRRC